MKRCMRRRMRRFVTKEKVVTASPKTTLLVYISLTTRPQ